jgi:hypothetical protein
MTHEEISLTVLTQGQVVVNFGYEFCRNEDTVLLEIDLKAKYAYVWATSETEGGCPEIWLDANENTIHLLEGAEGSTWLSLDDYAGYDIFCTEICKYSLRVSLVKKSVLQRRFEEN